jgi:hypothetical protein
MLNVELFVLCSCILIFCYCPVLSYNVSIFLLVGLAVKDATLFQRVRT